MGALTADGAAAGQWGDTGHAPRRWTIEPAGGAVPLINLNSGKALEIDACSTADGPSPGNGRPTASPAGSGGR
ncbi:RICIN domain-containing protein [Glycomyces tenuis]|uniref:RICIN domain-containing protein n=1 Tax=Glycomyces tenuis TaxID=58116 RepID=UPI0009DC3B09